MAVSFIHGMAVFFLSNVGTWRKGEEKSYLTFIGKYFPIPVYWSLFLLLFENKITEKKIFIYGWKVICLGYAPLCGNSDF